MINKTRCKCGCGSLTSGEWNFKKHEPVKFIKGHSNITRTLTEFSKNKKSTSMKNYLKNNHHPMLGNHHSKKTKEILSQKIKEWHKYNDNGFKGRKHSLETIKKFMKSRFKKPNNYEQKFIDIFQ